MVAANMEPVVNRRTVMGRRSRMMTEISLEPALLVRNIALPSCNVKASLV